MNLKYLHFLLFFFGVLGLTNCSSKKYISEVPYRYSSEEEYQAINTEKTVIENQYTNVDDNPEKLDDKKLRLKEKYAVLFGVMPKEIKNYDFYAYIDPWLGTPYRKQSLELQKAVDCSYFVQALYSDVFQACGLYCLNYDFWTKGKWLQRKQIQILHICFFFGFYLFHYCFFRIQ